MKIEDVKLTNVTEQDQSEYVSYIHFSVDSFSYTLLAYKPTSERSTFYIRDVIHVETNESFCRLCERPVQFGSTCWYLKYHLADVMKQIVAAPALRLPWLYRDYDIHEEEG